jgi:hypothetical protein
LKQHYAGNRQKIVLIRGEGRQSETSGGPEPRQKRM